MRKAIALSVATAALLVLVACKPERAVSITSTSGAGLVTIDDAVNLLTARRCDREIDCKNVGAGKRYDDRGGCERELAHALQVELGPKVCALGIREERLEECLARLREESCLDPLDSLDKIATCRRSRLCVN
jgi:hypothetical protein